MHPKHQSRPLKHKTCTRNLKSIVNRVLVPYCGHVDPNCCIPYRCSFVVQSCDKEGTKCIEGRHRQNGRGRFELTPGQANTIQYYWKLKTFHIWRSIQRSNKDPQIIQLWCSFWRPCASPEVASQSFADRSWDAVTTTMPDGSNTALFTSRSWVKVATASPVVMSQTEAVRSLDAVTMWLDFSMEVSTTHGAREENCANWCKLCMGSSLSEKGHDSLTLSFPRTSKLETLKVIS